MAAVAPDSRRSTRTRRPGTYNVILSVIDDIGRKKVFSAKPITVGTGAPVVVITFSPGAPHVHDRRSLQLERDDDLRRRDDRVVSVGLR